MSGSLSATGNELRELEQKVKKLEAEYVSRLEKDVVKKPIFVFSKTDYTDSQLVFKANPLDPPFLGAGSPGRGLRDVSTYISGSGLFSSSTNTSNETPLTTTSQKTVSSPVVPSPYVGPVRSPDPPSQDPSQVKS